MPQSSYKMIKKNGFLLLHIRNVYHTFKEIEVLHYDFFNQTVARELHVSWFI